MNSQWTIDPLHSSATFKVQHLGISWVNGTMHQITGDITLDDSAIENTTVIAKIDVSTISTGNENRDGHLKSADFFEIEKYPEITFKSKSAKKVSDTSILLLGDLTMHGVTKEEELAVEYMGEMPKPNQDGSVATVRAFSAHIVLDRTNYGLHWNMDLPGGKLLVGTHVDITLSIEAEKV